MFARLVFIFATAAAFSGCISRDNPVVDALEGITPDVAQCGTLPGVADGRDYVPRAALQLNSDGRTHPDVFYLGWSQLDARNDLRFPTNGYAGDGFEDKLFVSRMTDSGEVRSWQLLPMLDDNCQDSELIRIHSFDVAPDGRSLYVSMRRQGDTHLAIYEFDFTAYSFRKISQDDTRDFINPTYVGDHAETGHRMLFLARTVESGELPDAYGAPNGGILLDEYDRAPTPLIHSLDVETGDIRRIGLNNSHQTEPLSITHVDGTRLVVFTQWEHQQTTNRFSLWKLQVDGSDNFTFFGQESASDRSGANVFQAREIKTGPYAGYVLMTQGRGGFLADGSVVMTYREELDLRSDRVFLERADSENGLDIARNPEHYNDQSFVYAYRDTNSTAFGVYLKDYPQTPHGDTTQGARLPLMAHPDFHFVQPRSFYPPARQATAPSEGSIGQSRTSFSNAALQGRAGFLVQDLTQSDNGVQHQLDGSDPQDLRMQFFVPAYTLGNSQAVGKLGWGSSPELSVPASGFLSPETDGSFAARLRPGLYTWKLNKRFPLSASDVWIPVRAERQEISFVANRVNACNQCHQERSQANLELYRNSETRASRKMLGANLSGTHDISGYNSYAAVPDFHRRIAPMLRSCGGCHDAGDQLDLSNPTGARSQNSTWLNLVRGAHNLNDGSGEVVPYLSNSINPIGFDDAYQSAPFLWSLLLGDDLSVPPESGYPNGASRNLDRPGDYGATYDPRVEAAIASINASYDHSRHWSAAQVQRFITYSSTQSMVGLSDRLSFEAEGQGYTTSAAGQKAYQALVRRCFDCHNDHVSGGIGDLGFGLPLQKRYRSAADLRNRYLRLVIDSHLGHKDDTAYSPYLWQSDLRASMQNTLASARDRINFADPDASQLLVYARCDGLHDNVNHPQCLGEGDPDYDAIADWARGYAASNQAPILQGATQPIVIREYDEPALVGPITWSDPDSELSQLLINVSGSGEHSFNDSMLALEYDSLTAARVRSYAILGDRGDREFEFSVSDGERSSNLQSVPVRVESDYQVPVPRADLVPFTAFYTVRDTGELRRIDESGNDVSVGIIPGYTREFTTVYRRSDRGWLYFVEQSSQRIHVVNETSAALVTTIGLNHAPNRETDAHEQTVYLVWWRPAEYDGSGNLLRAGELQGLLESKQGDSRNGDFYVGLGDGEPGTRVVIPEYRTRLQEADNAVSVYVWRRATFMTQIAGNAVDRLNVLNLVTGKPKSMGDFSFAAKLLGGTAYQARDYRNVLAVFVSEDGAFYGVNQDLNSAPILFNFDPLEKVQVEVPLPVWLLRLMSDPVRFGTPFVVVSPRE
jgi:hypothetical protein